ncbi:MAG: MBL fold metallo-hydrolase [Lachnospiraceae bacterium]|nr:MBL fold metallo-hydrolase [Lachnospiraceae bacterium]
MKLKRKLLTLLTAAAMIFTTACEGTATTTTTNEETANASCTPYTVECYNVGKGDAFLITTESSAVMVDTGYKENGDDIIADMKSKGIEKLDMLIISHFDKDHVGGAAKIVKHMPIDRVFTPYQVKDSKRTEKFFENMEEAELTDETLTEEISIDLDGLTYDFYPAENNNYEEKASNNSSLAVRVTNGKVSMLFTGDAETARLAELTKKNLKSTILKVPYHGHMQDGLAEFMRSVQPSYSVITSSNDQPEASFVLTMLKKLNCENYLTRNGNVTFNITDSVAVTQTE